MVGREKERKSESERMSEKERTSESESEGMLKGKMKKAKNGASSCESCVFTCL